MPEQPAASAPGRWHEPGAVSGRGHVQISFGTGQKLLEAGLARAGIERRIMLELPAFLGLGKIIGTTDLLGTLPRHIGQTLADMHGLQVHDCPFEVEGFTVKQHWHARYHQDNGNRWLRRSFADCSSEPAKHDPVSTWIADVIQPIRHGRKPIFVKHRDQSRIPDKSASATARNCGSGRAVVLRLALPRTLKSPFKAQPGKGSL